MFNKKFLFQVLLVLASLTAFIYINLYSNYTVKLSFEVIYQSESDSDYANYFPRSCWTASYDPFHAIAMDYVNSSLKKMNPKYDKCNELNSEGTILISDTSRDLNKESYLITLVPDYILKREKLNKTMDYFLNCSVDEVWLESEVSNKARNLRYTHLVSDTINLAQVRPLEFKLNMSGFVQVRCLYNIDAKNNYTLVYDEVIWIYPANMTKLVEKNAPNRVEINRRFEAMRKNDSAENPMLYDVPYGQCDKVGGDMLEDPMNVLIIALDAVSLPHFKRIFPLTYKYLSKDLKNNIIFENLNVNGENTYAANVAFHAGLIKEPNPDIGVIDEVNLYTERFNQSNFHDLYPFLFRSFEKMGYFTSLNQDRSVFHYLKAGFR